MAAGPASYGMTDTMGRMHSDAQFAGSSSVKPFGIFLLRTSAIQASLIALSLSSVPAHVEMMGFLGIGNNPMVGCTVACAVDVATALNKQICFGCSKQRITQYKYYQLKSMGLKI